MQKKIYICKKCDYLHKNAFTKDSMIISMIFTKKLMAHFKLQMFFYEQFNATIYTNMVLWSIQCDNLHYKLQRFLWTIKCNDLCKMVVWRIQCYSLLKRDFYKNLNAWFLITMLLQISRCNYLHRSDFKNMNTMLLFLQTIQKFILSFCIFQTPFSKM